MNLKDTPFLNLITQLNMKSNFCKTPEIRRIRGFQALITSALAFSLMTVCVKKLNGRLPVAELIFVRSLISLLITRLLMKRLQINPWGTNKVLLLTRGFLGTGALFCVFQALFFLPLASATVIQYSYPTFTAIFANYFLGEGIRKRILLAIAIGWFGITLVAQPLQSNALEVQTPNFAIYIALAGAILTSLAYVSVRKLSKQEEQLVIVHYFPLVSVPICLPFLITQGVLPSSQEWIWLIGIGLFTQIGQQCITKGLSLLPAANASAISYSQVLFATIWGVFLFSETINFYIIAGSICVFGATLISLSAKADLDLA